MNCPLCVDSVLDVTFHRGIELDICPTCRGVWLDRGELDRIASGFDSEASRSTERSVAPARDRPGSGTDGRESRRSDDARDDRDDDRYDDRSDDRYDDRSDDYRRSKRKKSLGSRLGDIFEEIIDL